MRLLPSISEPRTLKRRTFLARTGTALAGSRIALTLPAALATWATACTSRDEGAFRVLSAREAAELEAIASRILPSPEIGPESGPESGGEPSSDVGGASEAGVIHFIDAALADLESGSLEAVRSGLEALLASVEREHEGAAFSALPEPDQIAALEAIEETEFFGTVRYLTLAGMFSHPSYGGNRDEVGWRLIGFDLQGADQPPFGYYDADYMEKGA